VDPETLLFQTSPIGNIDAIVQHDGRCVYFFLNENPNSASGKPKFGTRCVWVQNLERGPLVFNQSELEKGIPTILPRTLTVDREGLPNLSPEKIHVVWLEEGNAAALVKIDSSNEIDRVLAVIPPWSGRDGFHGYAAQCGAENEVCWPMPQNEMLQRRIANANSFWQSFESNANPFATLQPEQLGYYRDRFESEEETSLADTSSSNYFSIDGGKFPPRGLLQIKQPDSVLLLTVAMSLLPQPLVELSTDQPSRFRRIELGLRIPNPLASESIVDQARAKLSQLAAYPWSHFTWLGSGHSCNLSGIFDDREHAMLIDDALIRDDSTSPPPPFRNDPVNLLWLAPVTQQQIDDLANNPISKSLARQCLQIATD
jgi:hypothetical protein